MCEEINKLYQRLNELEREVDKGLDEVWAKVVVLEERFKKVQEVMKNL